MVLGGAAEPWGGGQAGQQAAPVQDGAQPPGVRRVGQGRAAGGPGQAPNLLPTTGPCWRPAWLSRLGIMKN